jgi:hypothetical protein
VTRLREPTAAEWAALGAVAPHPVDCDHNGATEQIAAEDAYKLVHSGLLTLIRYPLVRNTRGNRRWPTCLRSPALAPPCWRPCGAMKTRTSHRTDTDTDTDEQETS